MSNIAIPFLLKCDVVNNHSVKVVEAFFKQAKFATGSSTGEIILWKIEQDYIDPAILMVPSLNQSAGMVTSLALIELPEPDILVCSKTCLISAHSDGRLRIWDIDDGRCISVSPHELLENDPEITRIKPLFSHQRRFVICQGLSNNLYICDAWKMKILRELTSPKATSFLNFYVRNDKELFAIDDCNQIHIWDISPFNRPELWDYSLWVSKSNELNAFLRDVKIDLLMSKRFPDEMKFLQTVPSEKSKLIGFVILKNASVFVLLFNYKIVVLDSNELSNIEDFIQTKLKYLSIFINDADEFEDIQTVSLQEFESLMIQDKNGSIFHLGMRDVFSFWSTLVNHIDKEYHKNNTDHTYLKLKDLTHAQVNLQPIYVLNKNPQKMNGSPTKRQGAETDLRRPEGIMAVERSAAKLLYFDSNALSFKLFDLLEIIEQKFSNFYYTAPCDLEEINPYIQFKRRRSSILSKSFIENEIKLPRKEDILSSLIYNLRPEQPKSLSYFENIFHRFFSSCFGTGISNILQKNEEVVLTTIVFYEQIDPIYVFGTSKGRVLFFKMLFRETEQLYYYYVINFDTHPINVLFNRLNLLFVSSETGKVAVYHVSLSEWQKQHPEEEKGNSSLVAVDVTKKKKFEILLGSPLKRILQMKVLDHIEPSNLETDDSSLKESIKQQHSALVGLILKNNSVICFDTTKLSIEFECRCNEHSVLGLFINPFYEYLLILNANGAINIFSTFSGMYERSVSIKEKDFSFILGVEDLMSEYKKLFYDTNKYQNFKKDRSTLYPSPVHTMLEYLTRGQKYKIDYFGKVSDQEGPKKFEVIKERLGDAMRLASTSQYSPHLVMLLHYCNELLFSTRYSRSGTLFLSLLLDQTYHILITDPKYSSEDEEKRRARLSKEYKKKESTEKTQDEAGIKTDPMQKSKKKSIEHMELGFALMTLVYPWGIDQDIEKDIKAMGNYTLPVFEMYYGVQGVGESFSFLISEKNDLPAQTGEIIPSKGQQMVQYHKPNDALRLSVRNWRTSEYLTTTHALSIMLYFVINSHLQGESVVTVIMMRLVELLNKRCPTHIQNFKEINICYLNYFITSEDSEIVSSMSNLVVSALIQAPKERDTELTTKMYRYLRISLENPAIGKGNRLYCIETAFLSSLCYWSCFSKLSSPLIAEIIEFIVDKILRIIDISHCLHYPNSVSAALKLLVDGLSRYHKHIKKIEDVFFNILMIDFHYSMTLDDALLNTLQTSEDVTIKSGKAQSTIIVKLSRGESYREEFISFISLQAKNVSLTMDFPTIAINTIRQYIKKHPKSALNNLPKLAEAILYCLDPNNPVLRKNCQKAATSALQAIFKTYPSCAFNHATQKFAISTPKSTIMVYDLRTAVCIKTLEGHKEPISCVLFDEGGSQLASFSSGDLSLRVWKISGFFGSVIGLGGKYKKTFELQRNQLEGGGKHSNERKYRLDWRENEGSIALIIDDTYTICLDMRR